MKPLCTPPKSNSGQVCQRVNRPHMLGYWPLLISADAQDYIRFDFTLTAALASTARDSATDSRQVCQGVNHQPVSAKLQRSSHR